MSFYRQYFIRNCLLAFIAVSFVVASIVMVNFFDRLLEQIAAGNIDEQFLLPLVGAGFLRYFTFAFGTAACLGGTYLLSQMHQRHEITTWKASGEGASGILRLLTRIGLLFALLSSIFYLWITPATERYYAHQYELARQSAESRLLSAQQFSALPNIGQMYVETYDKNTSQFTDSFLVVEDPTQRLKRITTAQSGSLSSTPRAFKVHKVAGRMIGIQHQKVTEVLEFSTLDYVNPRPVDTTISKLPIEQRASAELLTDIADTVNQSELGKRLGLVFFVFNNTLLVGLLLFTKPRRSQVMSILAIIVIHLLYRYGVEWQLTLPIYGSISPLFWPQIPHLLFLAGFFLLWIMRREL